MKALELAGSWPVTTVGTAVVTRNGTVATNGAVDVRLQWASVTKVLSALTTWVAVEEGTLALDEPAGPPGSTVGHLLAHASGLPFEGDTVRARPGERRIYSNRGFEVLADAVAAAAGMPFAEYVHEAVVEPLGMRGTRLEGSPASGAVGPVVDLARLAAELLRPTVVAPTTVALVTAVAFPGLAGLLPGFGHQDPNDWGLGVEIRDAKAPHWTPATASPRTFGHFGRAGGFLWVDPTAGAGCVCLTDRDFGDWARHAWPELGDAVLTELAGPARP